MRGGGDGLKNPMEDVILNQAAKERVRVKNGVGRCWLLQMLQLNRNKVEAEEVPSV
jgi:hypothetical protein